MDGRTPATWNSASNVMRPKLSWKKTADMPIVAIARAMALAMSAPLAPQRVDSDVSATATTPAVLGCSNSRTIIGLKLVMVDCAHSTCDSLSPGCHSRSPTKSNPRP